MSTVSSKVRNLRKVRNFEQNFPIFFEFANCNIGFGQILIKVINILVQNKFFILWKLNFEAKIESIFYKPRGKFFIEIYIWAKLQWVKLGGNSGDA